MLAALRSLWTWSAIIFLIIIWLPLLAVIRLFDRDPALYRTGRWFRRLGAAMTRVNPAWHIQVSGLEHVDDPRRPYVVVSNHQSQADIPIVSLLPWEMKWVGKAELFRIPFVGAMMKLAGDIAVDRDSNRSRAQVLIKARDYLHKKCSVIFFAEGTRSPDGQVMAFNDGAFRLAIKEQVPVLPIAIEGTQDALPKHSWKFNTSGPMYVKVLPPMATEGLKKGDTAALRGAVRDRIIEQIAAWRGTTPEAVDALAAAHETSAKATASSS